MSHQENNEASTVTPTLLRNVLNATATFLADLHLAGGNATSLSSIIDDIQSYMCEYGEKYPDRTFELMYPWEFRMSPAGCTTIANAPITELRHRLKVMVDDAPSEKAKQLAEAMYCNFVSCLEQNEALIRRISTAWDSEETI